MRAIDKMIAVCLLLVAIICLFNTNAPAGFAGNLTMFLFFALLMFFVGGYPKRIRLAKHRKLLLSQPVHSVIAEKISCQSVNTGYQVDGVVNKDNDKHRQRDTNPIGNLMDAKQAI